MIAILGRIKNDTRTMDIFLLSPEGNLCLDEQSATCHLKYDPTWLLKQTNLPNAHSLFSLVSLRDRKIKIL